MEDTESSETKPTELLRPEALAILQLRSSVVYPYMPQQLTASRAHSIRAVEAAQADGDLIAIFAQRSAEAERPSGEDLHVVGTVAKIHKVWRMPDASMRLIVQGIDRARLGEIVYDEPFMRAKVEVMQDEEDGDGDSMAVQAMSRTVLHQFQAIVRMMPHLPDELQVMVVNIDHPGRLCDFVASNLDLQLVEHQHLLEALNVKERLQSVSYNHLTLPTIFPV